MKNTITPAEHQRIQSQYNPSFVGRYTEKALRLHQKGFTRDTARNTLFPLLDTLKKGSSFLDLGCGAGLDMERNIKHGFNVHGFDSSKAMVTSAKNRVGPELVKCGDFEKRLPYEAEKFDAVYSIFALHYAKRPEVVFDQVARILRPGGSFLAIISHPMINYLCSRAKTYGEISIAKAPLFDRKDPVTVTHYAHTFSSFLTPRILKQFSLENFFEQDVVHRKYKAVVIKENVPEWFLLGLRKKENL